MKLENSTLPIVIVGVIIVTIIGWVSQYYVQANTVDQKIATVDTKVQLQGQKIEKHDEEIREYREDVKELKGNLTKLLIANGVQPEK